MELRPYDCPDDDLEVSGRKYPISDKTVRSNQRHLKPVVIGPIDPYEFPLRQENQEYRSVFLCFCLL